jgi:hypothetical protein
VSTRAVNRGGLLVSRLTAQASARLASSERRLTLAGTLPADDLASEVARLLRTALLLEAEAAERPAGELVRSYVRSTKDKGVHDHGTGLRSTRVRQVLEGAIQHFLDERLKRARGGSGH